MKIMMTGDVVGRPGRKAFSRYTPDLRKKYDIDVVIVNGENSAGGKGFTRKSLDELYAAGADIVTSGNHVWDKKDVLDFIDDEPYLVRPGNYPDGTPGKGWCIYPFRKANIAVMNLSGRAFMPALDDPFRVVDDMLEDIGDEADVVILDFHAETTSEKMAMGWYLDGRVNAVAGTHTHIQTADDRLLPNDTAYITDLGMTGPWNSVLGVKTDKILEKFLSCRPVRFDVADGPCVYSAVIITIDDSSYRTTRIERLQLREDEMGNR